MKKFLTTLLIVMGLLTASIVGAAVQMFDGKGEWHTSDAENQQIAQQRAQQRAQLDAQKKAGVYLKTFSRSVNLELADDEITAVTNNIIEIVGDVHFDKKIIPLSESQTTILYTATLKAKIDPDGVLDFVKRDDKVTIVRQNNDLQDAIQKNDELAASLTEQYNRATSQAERDRIRKQMEQADRDFLANQKTDEGWKLWYKKDFNGAKNLFDEAINLNPDNASAYFGRGTAYSDLNQYGQAIQDLDRAIQLNPNLYQAYNNRGNAYDKLGQYEPAIQDYDKAIRLNPNFYQAYHNRGVAYNSIGQHERAIRDLDAALALNPNLAEAYYNRGLAYEELKQYERAIQDYNRSIELNIPEIHLPYYHRGIAYALSGNFNQAIADATRAIQLNPNYAKGYQLRGLCYQQLGDNAKAQADFAKANQLGFNG